MYTDGRRSAAKRLPLTFSLVQKTGAGQLMARMKELERENAQLKRMYADALLRADVVQRALEKKW